MEKFNKLLIEVFNFSEDILTTSGVTKQGSSETGNPGEFIAPEEE